jgi:hypothetical protein
VHTRLLVTAAIAACVVFAFAPSADAKMRGCKTRGQYTIVANSRARVFFANRDTNDDGEEYACLYGRKRDKRLTTDLIDTAGRGGDFFQLSDPDAGDQLVAFTQEECGTSYCDYTAKSIDLDTGLRIRRATGHSIISLLLVRGGSLAILEETSYPWESQTIYSVKKVEASGTTVLDTGPDIDPNSLAVSSHWVYWRDGGVTREAPMQ